MRHGTGILPIQVLNTLILTVLLLISLRAGSAHTPDPDMRHVDPSLRTDATMGPNGACSTPHKSIVVQDDILNEENAKWEDEVLYVDFNIVPAYQHQHLFCPWSATLFNAGSAVGSCKALGRCKFRIDDTPFGSMMMLMLVISSPPDAILQDKVNFCFEAHNSEEVDECKGIVSIYQLKINMHLPDHLAPALSLEAVGFVTGIEVGYRRYVLANEYDIDDEASLLFDPIASPNCTEVTIVSPLRSQDQSAEAISAWRQGWTAGSVMSGEDDQECIALTDGMHTLRIHCPVPPSARPAECAPGAAIEGMMVRKNGVAIWSDPSRTILAPLALPISQVDGPAGGGSGLMEERVSVEVCTMVRNEASNIVEWVEYHLQAGVDRIHIYLHMTVDDTAHLLEPYALAGRVVMRGWDFDWTSAFVKVQTHAQNDCLARAAASRSPPSWLLNLDVDEFIVVADQEAVEGGASIGRVLEESGGEADAVKLAWLQYSSRDRGATGLTFERYLWHEDRFVGGWWMDSKIGKIAARPSRGVHVSYSSHSVSFPPGAKTRSTGSIFLAHYIGRDLSYERVDSALVEGADAQSAAHWSCVKERRSAVDGTAQWQGRTMLALTERLRRWLCARDPERYPEAARLCGTGTPGPP